MALDLFSSNTPDKRRMIFKQAIKFAEKGFYPSWHLLNASNKTTGIMRFEKNPTFNHSNLRYMTIIVNGIYNKHQFMLKSNIHYISYIVYIL